MSDLELLEVSALYVKELQTCDISQIDRNRDFFLAFWGKLFITVISIT